MDPSKGKGRAEAPGERGAPSRDGSQAPRWTGLGAEMQSLMAGQGKGSSAGGQAQAASLSAMADASIAQPAQTPSAGARFRSTGDDAGARAERGTVEFNAFERGQEASWAEQYKLSSEPPKEPVSSLPQVTGADNDMLNSVWRQTVPPPRPVAPDNFLDALAAEEQAEEASPASVPQPTVPTTVPLTDEWQPPTPWAPTTMSREEHEMHVRLAEAQAASADEQPYRAAERTAPPEDDEALREGVYAATPEAALESVWNTQGMREARARAFREQGATEDPRVQRGREAVQRLRDGWLVREGYTDEVYGLPPTLARTFGEATQEPGDAQQEEQRAKAIRRLDALYRHLQGPGATQPGASSADAMEAYLRGPGSQPPSG